MRATTEKTKRGPAPQASVPTFRSLTAALLLAALLCGACSGRRDAQRSGREEDRLTIGFSIATATFIIERWNKDLKVFTGAAQELGADVIVQLSAGGIQEQIAQINYMLNQNIDILVVVPHDTGLITGAIRQVREAGIPVVAYDRLIQGIPIEAYVSFDSAEVGRHYGQALIRAVPRGRYLVVNGSVHDVNSADISRGLHEVIDPFIQSGAIRLGREIWLEEWSSDEALEKIGAIFREGADFDAIACGNDAIANAAIQLLSERRLAGKVAVVGQDAELISCQRIVEGTQLMTVYKPIGALGVRAARVAVAVARQESIRPDTLVDNDSGAMIPAFLEKTTAVFKDNIDVVIRDGFHSREDVYRNITR
ncbi:MAG: substrate-binding domain-containing protein [Treponema sp.]|jgi:D-xylose transport system substrate-binding protein|nr:substrate-binding domain-containing protein [Treponema sp.]